MLRETPNAGFDASKSAPGIKPPKDSVFQPVDDSYGVRLALVFGNHALGGQCPFYPSGHCHHCDIGKGEGIAFDNAMNNQRLEWFSSHYAEVWSTVAHLVIYNSGSVLNAKEMPTEVLHKILDFASGLSNCRVISLDSREPFIKSEVISRLVERVGDERCLRPILGLETSDDHRRNGLLKKQMPERAVVKAFQTIGNVAAQVGRERIGLDVNIVVSGPGTKSDTAVEDAVATALFAWETGRIHGVGVDLNLHAYYPSSRGRERFPTHGRCSLGTLIQATKEITGLRRTLGVEGAVFIGWQDEGHDQEQEKRQLELKKARAVLDRFNATQDVKLLETLGSV